MHVCLSPCPKPCLWAFTILEGVSYFSRVFCCLRGEVFKWENYWRCTWSKQVREQMHLGEVRVGSGSVFGNSKNINQHLKVIGSWRHFCWKVMRSRLHSQSLLHQSHLIVSFILQLQPKSKELKTKWLAQLISTHRARKTKCEKIENKRRRSDLFVLLCRLFCVQRICFVSSSSSLLSGMVFNLTPLESEEETFDPYSQEIETQEYSRTAEIEIHVSKWDSQLLLRCV